MENKPLRNLYLMGAVLAVLCLCFVVLPPLFGAMKDVSSAKAGQKDLTCVGMALTDLPQGLDFKLRGQTGSCDSYLNLDLTAKPQRCYQVMASTDDKSLLLLNAIWEYPPDMDAQVQYAYASLVAQKPVDSFDLEIGLPPGIAFGDQSTRSRLSLQRPFRLASLMNAKSVIYADSVYWRSGKWLMRITSLDSQGSSRVDLIGLAHMIQLRLTVENVCMSQ